MLDVRKMVEDDLVTVNELAEVLGITKQRILELVRIGVYKPVKEFPTYGKGEKMSYLFLKTEILNLKKEEEEEKWKFFINHIPFSLAMKIVGDYEESFLFDIEEKIIEKTSRKGRVYINLENFKRYVKKYEINLDGMVNSSYIKYALINIIEEDVSLSEFVKENNIQTHYLTRRGIEYALFDEKDVLKAVENGNEE